MGALAGLFYACESLKESTIPVNKEIIMTICACAPWNGQVSNLKYPKSMTLCGYFKQYMILTGILKVSWCL